MQPELLVPTHNEKDYCHFCFGAINLVLVFPYVRPDLKSFIDNVIGIQLTTDAQETFTLCGECIGTMDMFTNFRAKCRSHYDKVRETNILNQAVKKMFPLMEQQRSNLHLDSPSSTTSVKGLDESCINGDLLYPEVRLVEVTTNPTNGLTEPVNSNAGSARSTASKRINALSPSPEIAADSTTKQSRTQNEANRKTKHHHIRDLMKRFRENRLPNNNFSPNSSQRLQNHQLLPSSILPAPKRIDVTNNQPIANCSTSTTSKTPPPCKPCVVVVRKCLIQENGAASGTL